MNKVKMGKFLRHLRKDKHISIETLSNEFRKDFIEVSINAISSWENGKTIPDIDNLNFLATYYGVTVDDILNGEKYEEVDFNTIYFLHQQDWIFRMYSDEKANPRVTDILADEAIRVRVNFKKLVHKYINGLANYKETRELIFLLKNYYLMKDELSVNEFLVEAKKLKKQYGDNDSVWWEVQKMILPIDTIKLYFAGICDENYDNAYVKRIIDYIEDWEKDMLLATIQRRDPIYHDPTRRNSEAVKKYEAEHGKKYDAEQITKDTIKFLINHGACINREYLGRKAGNWDWYRVIDTLETAHNYLDKPLEICVSDNNKYKHYYVENTERNRFFANHRFGIVSLLKQLGYSYDEMYELVSKNWEVPDEVRLRLAELKQLDINEDFDYIKADTSSDLIFLEHEWMRYKDEWYQIDLMNRSNKEHFEEELAKGEHENTIMRFSWVGGIAPKEVEEYVLSVNQKETYKEFVSNRKVNRTKRLLDELELRDMGYIRDQFFQLGDDKDE